MSYPRRQTRWPSQVAALALAGLTLAIGFCLFDGHNSATDDHGMALDLCCGLVVSSVAVTLLSLVVVSRVPGEPRRLAYAAAPRRIDPPPKSLSRS